MTNASNGTLAIASAVGTIANDDLLPPPTLRIAPVHAQQAEGDTSSTAFTFAVSRSGDLSTQTTVQYEVNGSAIADDFAGGMLPGGTVVFAPGSAEQLLTIHVAGDHQIERHEVFAVSLHNPSNGTIATGSAEGVIFNDDTSSFKIGDAPARPSRSDAGPWETSWSHAGAQNGEDFVYGAYGNEAGNGFGSEPYSANGGMHGSEYLIDSVGFTAGYVDLLWAG